MWLEKSASPMILLHMGYGIGSLSVPLYSNPFLAEPMPETERNCTIQHAQGTTAQATGCLNDTISVTKSVRYIKETRIQYPYFISAGLVALLSLVFFVYQVRHFRERRKVTGITPAPETVQEVKTVDVNDNTSRKLKPWIQQQIKLVNPASCAAGRFWYGVQIFGLILFYHANIGGGERMIANFVRTFSIDQLGFSKDDGSFVNTSFWVSFTAGRFLFFILARWISIRKLVFIETGGLLATGILMNIFARDNATAYWVLTQPLGLFVAPIWPSGVGWADYHVELTGLAMAFILLGGSVGGFAHLRLIGYLYQHVGHVTYLYQMVGFGAALFVLVIVMNLVGSQHGNRFKQKQDTIEMEENIPEKNTFNETFPGDHM